MTFFWILWGFDALIALIVLYFFAIGLLDGSVSSFNMKLWLGLLIALAAIMGGSLWLRAAGYLKLAKAVLLILAVPGFLYALFALFMLLGKPRWN